MTARNSGRLAIHRRSDEIAFLQDRLRALQREATPAATDQSVADLAEQKAHDALLRQRELADELLHTRQTEPLGEALQRRLAMAERICRELVSLDTPASDQQPGFMVYRLAEIERLALAEMLQHWWARLREL